MPALQFVSGDDGLKISYKCFCACGRVSNLRFNE